jgi:hypothetical protein
VRGRMNVTYFGAVDDRIESATGLHHWSAKIARQAYKQYLLRGRARYRVESSLWLG